MPKKKCCCEGGSWVAVPCRSFAGMAFAGFHPTGTGFSGINGSDTSIAMRNFLNSLKPHPVFGSCGYFKDVDPYYKFPDENGLIGFGIAGMYGLPPTKIKLVDCDTADPNDPTIFRGVAIGTSLLTISGNGGGWGSGGPFGSGFDAQCTDLICWKLEIDTDRKVTYKAWGAGGGGFNSQFPGGNGAYAQKNGTYNKDYFACIGYGGLGFKPGRSFTGWTGAIETVPAGGGQGYGAWGGGAAFVATDVTSPESAFIIAGGGGGAGKQPAPGGHGGVTSGLAGKGSEGGGGGTQTTGGCGGTYAQDGQGTKGGRGAFVNINGGGGGGGGGKRGGGGGGSAGYGGGGGSSTIDEYSESGSDLGPPNMCDPDYWIYDIGGLGGNKKITGSVGWIPTNPYTDGTGTWGKVALLFSGARCLCDSNKDEIPDRSYICLTDAQAQYICEQTQNCCVESSGISGASGPAGISGASGASGASGSSGYNPCASLANFNTQLDPRGVSGNSGGTGGTQSAQDLPYGSGYGGSGVGAFTCPDSGFGLTGLTGITFSTTTGEVDVVLYKTFRYEGELYYLLYQCGVNCDSQNILPDDAVFTDIRCRPWADCCQGLWAFPVCKEKKTQNQSPNCWAADECPCNPIDPCPSKGFVECVDNIDDYPDTFWTKKDDWYYIVSKTSLWVPFGDISYFEQGTIGEIILEDPCCQLDDGFGGGPVVVGGEACDQDDGDDTEPVGGCCESVQEAWIGKSPWKANVNVSMQWQGRGEYFPGCSVSNTCDCAIEGGVVHNDSYSVSVVADPFGNFFKGVPEPPCPQPGGLCPNGFIEGIGRSFTYTLISGGIFGIGLQEQCYPNVSYPCLPLNSGVPTREEEQVPPDALIRATTECVIRDDENCNATGAAGYFLPGYLVFGGGIAGIFNPCENDSGGPDSQGPRVYANGCRVSTYVARLNALFGGKITFTDISPSDKYWLGLWRDEQLGVPGDQFVRCDTDEQIIVTNYPNGGQKIVRRATYTLYYASPAYGIRVFAEMTMVPKCCGQRPYARWFMSGCGRAPDPDFACAPCVGCACPYINSSSYVVPTFKTLVQWEETPNVNSMLNTKCEGIGSGFLCPDRWDDMDGPQICNITLT